MTWLLLCSLLPSMLVAWLFGFVIRKQAPSWGLVARPGGHSTHEQPTPCGGGLAIWLGVVLPLAVGQFILGQLSGFASDDQLAGWLGHGALRTFVEPHLPGLRQQSSKLWFLLSGGTLMVLLGLWDDLRRVDWKLRLAIQTAVATAVVVAGWRLTLFLDAPLVTGALSVVWIVGLINAFNMLDNMDGLSAGVAAIAATILATVILTAPNPITHGPQLFVGGLLLVLVGALLGFLYHNRTPAKLFMGDAGSYFVGYMVATSTISATFAGQDLPRHAILAPLCVLAVPIYDMLTVIWIRLREGRSPFAADRNHLSHRLVDLGLSRKRAVEVIYLATILCGLGAFCLHLVGTAGAVAVGVLIAAILCALAFVELTSRRRAKSDSSDRTT